jgi:hypothetical protein
MLPGSGVTVVVMLRVPVLRNPASLKLLLMLSVPSDLQPFVHLDVKLNVWSFSPKQSPPAMHPFAPEKEPPVIVPANEN